MNNVISFAAARAERLKQALSIHARNGEAVVVETANGPIAAEKIACRGRFAEIFNSVGDYFVVAYADIRSLRPVAAAQTSIVNASGDFLPFHERVTAAPPVEILPFARKQRRR
jgi:hypothetical protein